MCLSQLLPAYSLFLQGIRLSYSFTEATPSELKEKTRVILLKSPAGTLLLEVNYIKYPDNIENILRVHVPSVHGSSTPPCIEWQAASLSVSETSSDLSPPFSPLGNEVMLFAPEIMPKYLMANQDDQEAPVKAERKSFDVSQLAKECASILGNFEDIIKQIESNEEVMKEYYSLLVHENK